MAVIYSKKLDFGGTATPIATGYVRFGAAAYTATRGFGWVGTGLTLLDTGFTADPLTRDCVRGNDAELHLDVPNGTYTVKLTRVDPRQRPDRVTITVGGVAGPPAVVEQTVWHETITDHQVTDGKLKIQFASDGLAASYFGLAALEVEGVDVPVPPPPGDLPDLPGLVTGSAVAVPFLTHQRDRTPYLQGALLVRFATTAQAILGEAVPPSTVNTPGAYALALDATGVVGKAGLALVGGTILNNMVRADAAVMDGTPHTLCVSWDSYWMWLYVDGVLVAEGNKGRDPEPSQITEDDYFQGVAPTDMLLTNLRSVSHSLLADATWTVANVATAHEWASGVTPPPPLALTATLALDPPEIAPGETATLTWTTTGATRATFGPVGQDTALVALNGSQQVSPPTSTSYFLRAYDDASGEATFAGASLLVRRIVPAVPLGTARLTTSWGSIPDFGDEALVTCETVADGPASSPDVWKDRKVPGQGDVVAFRHQTVWDMHGDLPLATAAIKSGAVLSFDPTRKTRLTTSNVLVYEGGAVRIVSDPARSIVFGGTTASLALYPAPLSANDPLGFGNGLLCFGEFTVDSSMPGPSIAYLAKNVERGDTVLEFAVPVTGWVLGEKFLIPDTRPVVTKAERDAGARWELVTIRGVAADGHTVTLTEPVQYDHLDAGQGIAVGRMFRDVGLRNAEHLLAPRPHILFADNAKVSIQGAILHSTGRTDTTKTNYLEKVVGRTVCQFYGMRQPFLVRDCVSVDVLPAHPVSTRRWGFQVEGCPAQGIFERNVVFNWAGAGIAFLRLGDSTNIVKDNLITFMHGVPEPFTGFAGDLGMGGAGVFSLAKGNVLTGNFISDVTEAVREEYEQPVALPLALAPLADFSSTVGALNSLTAEISGGFPPYFPTWTWGDGTTSTTAAAAHAYTAPGSYTVTLRVMDALGNEATAGPVQATVTDSGPLPPEGRFYFTRSGDRLADYCHGSTFTTVKAGDALDPAVWSTGKVPGASDRVVPNHALTLAGKLVCHSWRTGPAGTLTLLAGAELWCFTFQDHETSEFACSASAQIVIRNGPIDTAYDPEQWGHGIIITGGWTTTGQTRSPYVSLVKEALTGQSTLTLATAAVSWKAGDRLVLPDMRQLDVSNGAAAAFGQAPYEWQGQEVTIASVSADGKTVTLIAPLAYDCKAVVEPDGVTVAFRPVVQHLTRDLVIRSENPTGTRGHVVFLDAARVDCESLEVRDCGRTTNAPPDNTQIDESGSVLQIGTNQEGRYGVHFHRCTGRPQFVGNSVGNAGVSHLRKWGINLHGTSDAIIADNVVYNWAGAGINAEDGSEQRNRIERNYLVRVRGPHGTVVELTGAYFAAGIWMIDTSNVVRGNLINSCPDGIGVMFFPKQLGFTNIPLADCSDNKVFGATSDGFHIWNLGTDGSGQRSSPWSVVKGLAVYHCHGSAMFNYNVARVEWLNFDVCGDATLSGIFSPSMGFQSSEYMLEDCILRGGKIRGVATCWAAGNVTLGTTLIEDCYFDAAYQNTLIGSLVTGAANAERCGPRKVIFRRVRFGDLVSRMRGEQRNFVMNWYDFNGNLTALDETLVYAHNGNPNDNFRLYYDPQQRPDYVLIGSIFHEDGSGGGYYQVKASPEPGLTNAQLWAKYGVAAGGKVMPVTAVAGTAQGVYDGLMEPIPAE